MLDAYIDECVAGIRRIENLSSCTNIQTLVLCGNQVWCRLTQQQEDTAVMPVKNCDNPVQSLHFSSCMLDPYVLMLWYYS